MTTQENDSRILIERAMRKEEGVILHFKLSNRKPTYAVPIDFDDHQELVAKGMFRAIPLSQTTNYKLNPCLDYTRIFTFSSLSLIQESKFIAI